RAPPPRPAARRARPARRRPDRPVAGAGAEPGRAPELAAPRYTCRWRSSMIKPLDDMPPGVIGFETHGTIQAEDYRDVVLPTIVRAAEAGDVRFVIVVPDFQGMSGGALWEDLKLGVQHLRAWKRIALVTDIEWMRQMTALFGWMTPGETKTFP